MSLDDFPRVKRTHSRSTVLSSKSINLLTRPTSPRASTVLQLRRRIENYRPASASLDFKNEPLYKRELMERYELADAYAHLREILPASCQKASEVSLLVRAATHIQYLNTIRNQLEAKLKVAESEINGLKSANESLRLRTFEPSPRLSHYRSSSSIGSTGSTPVSSIRRRTSLLSESSLGILSPPSSSPFRDSRSILSTPTGQSTLRVGLTRSRPSPAFRTPIERPLVRKDEQLRLRASLGSDARSDLGSGVSRLRASTLPLTERNGPSKIPLLEKGQGKRLGSPLGTTRPKVHLYSSLRADARRAQD